jgi:hypothetical protein
VPVSVGERARTILWARAGGRCALCRRKLQAPAGEAGDEAVEEGRIARITDRGDDRYDNLILLCGADYAGADSEKAAARSRSLKRLKSEHEEWVRRTVDSRPLSSPSSRYDPRFGGVTLLPRIHGGRQLVALLGGIHSIQHDHDVAEADGRHHLVGPFLQYLRGIVDVWERYDEAERDRVARHLDRQIEGLRRAGLLLCGDRRIAAAGIGGIVGEWVILRVWILSEILPQDG